MDFAVTFPFTSTLAIWRFPTLQLTFLLLASSGVIVAFSWTLFPISTLISVSFNLIPVGLISFAVTRIMHLASNPFAVSAYTYVFPMDFAVTFPFASTLAIWGFPTLQLTFLLLASSGVIVAFSWTLFPISTLISVSFNFIPIGLISFAVTRIMHLASNPFAVSAYTYVFPMDFAVTFPFVSTLAIWGFPTLQLIWLYSPNTSNWIFFPNSTVTSFSLNEKYLKFFSDPIQSSVDIAFREIVWPNSKQQITANNTTFSIIFTPF